MEIQDDTGRILVVGNSKSDRYSSDLGSKPVVALVTVAIVLSSVAFVVALISLTQSGDVPSITEEEQSGPDRIDDKIWTIATGFFPHSDIYVDESSGEFKGFHVDIINAVCRLANKNCRLMYDTSQRCWDSQAGQVPRGGEGLLGGWYDACGAWTKSNERARTFKFSKSWMKPPQYFFLVKADNPDNFNPRDVTGVKFGFVDGYTNDEFCLARQRDITGSSLTASQIMHYPNLDTVENAVISGEVTATIGYGDNLPSTLMAILDVDPMDCSLDASGRRMMLRMDSALIDWWDPALDRLMQSSEYREICHNIKQEHGHLPGREPEDQCIGL